MQRVLVCLAATAALAGCGSKTVDTEKGEQLIETEVTEQLGLQVASVDCPEEVEPEAGASFECTVRADDGSSGIATVTQKDDKGNVSFSAQFLPIHEREEQIAADIERQTGGSVEVDCPEIVVAEQGATFECEGTSDGEVAVIEVTQTDDQGAVDYQVRRP